jgi:hypothetical protein
MLGSPWLILFVHPLAIVGRVAYQGPTLRIHHKIEFEIIPLWQKGEIAPPIRVHCGKGPRAVRYRILRGRNAGGKSVIRFS